MDLLMEPISKNRFFVFSYLLSMIFRRSLKDVI